MTFVVAGPRLEFVYSLSPARRACDEPFDQIDRSQVKVVDASHLRVCLVVLTQPAPDTNLTLVVLVVAAQSLALNDTDLSKRVDDYRAAQTAGVPDAPKDA